MVQIMRKAPNAGDERGSLTGSLPRPKDMLPTQTKDETQHWRALSLPGSPVQVDKCHRLVGKVKQGGGGCEGKIQRKATEGKDEGNGSQSPCHHIQTSSIPAKSEPRKTTEECPFPNTV